MKWSPYDPIILIPYDVTGSWKLYAITGTTNTDNDIKYCLCNGGSNSNITFAKKTDLDEYYSYIWMYVSDGPNIGKEVLVSFKYVSYDREYRCRYLLPDEYEIPGGNPWRGVIPDTWHHDDGEEAIQDYGNYCDYFETNVEPLLKRLYTCTGASPITKTTTHWERGNVLARCNSTTPVPLIIKTYSGNGGMATGSIYLLSENPRVVNGIPFGPPVLSNNGGGVDFTEINRSNEAFTTDVTVDFKLSIDDENSYSVDSSSVWVTFGATESGTFNDTIMADGDGHKLGTFRLNISENTTGENREAIITVYWGGNLEQSYTIKIKQRA